jgi:hypothetical protein
MNPVDLIWGGREADDYCDNRVRHAQRQSDLAAARLAGMKIRARLNQPIAAKGGFPYAARTCAQWTPFEAWVSR